MATLPVIASIWMAIVEQILDFLDSQLVMVTLSLQILGMELENG